MRVRPQPPTGASSPGTRRLRHAEVLRLHGAGASVSGIARHLDLDRNSVLPDAGSVLRQIPVWLAHYNDLHPHRAPGYRSPREFIARSIHDTLSSL